MEKLEWKVTLGSKATLMSTTLPGTMVDIFIHTHKDNNTTVLNCLLLGIKDVALDEGPPDYLKGMALRQVRERLSYLTAMLWFPY